MVQDLILAAVGAGAAVLLVAGLAQVFSVPRPRRRRGVRRRVRVSPEGRLRERVSGARSRSRPGERTVAGSAAARETKPAASVEPSASPSRRSSVPVFTPRSKPAAPEAAPPVAAPSPAEPAPSAAVAARAAPPTEAELPLDRCSALYGQSQYQEVIQTAEPALQRALGEASGTAPRASDIAGLWSLLGLSRQALADEEGARSALEEAIHAAPEADRPQYRQQLGALALDVSRSLLGRVEQLGEGPGEARIATLKQAVLWLRQGLAEVSGDMELSSALDRARGGLWTAYEQSVTGLIERQEFHRARRLIGDALADREFPVDPREKFGKLLASTFTGEIGQLTASAIRALEDERGREALTFLQRAEEVLSCVPVDGLSSKRREEANRRLWWGYTKLGMRRVEAKEYEDAVEPLFHALKMAEASPERQQETREAIVRAFVGVAEARAAAITQLLRDRKRSAAREGGERLRALMREGLERGLTQQELSPAFAKARLALESIDQGPGA